MAGCRVEEPGGLYIVHAMRHLRLVSGSILVLALGVAAAADPAHYELRAHIDPAAGTIAAKLTMQLPPEEAKVGSGYLLGDRFKVTSVDAGKDASFETAKTDKPFPGLQLVTVRAKAGAAAPRRIHIAYEGPLNVPPGGGSPVVMAAPERVELFLDSMWLPTRDDLGLQYTVDAQITGLSTDMVVVGQGDITRKADAVHFKRPFGDNDFAFVAAKGLQRVVEDDVEIYALDLASPHVQLYRRHAVGALEYYKPWFGPMRHRPIRIVAVSRTVGPGYARPAYVVVAERGGASGPNERGAAGYLGHEIGHGWWNVGGPTTEDYWMSESVASYVSWRYAEKLGMGPTAEELAKVREACKTIGPILGNGRPSGQAVYTKGPVLLVDLEQRIGRPAIDRVLGELGRNPPRVTADFLAVVAKIAGADAARAFEADMRKDGY
jgi:hypothetical protein